MSSVLDGHDHTSRTRHVRLKANGDVDAARPFEGVQSIAQDVEHNLLEHPRVRLAAEGYAHRPPPRELLSARGRRCRHQHHRLGDDLRYLDGLERRFALANVVEETIDD